MLLFDIVPNIYHPYKLMIVTALDKRSNKTFIICFILVTYIDLISYTLIFKYLNENYYIIIKLMHSMMPKYIFFKLENDKKNLFKFT